MKKREAGLSPPVRGFLKESFRLILFAAALSLVIRVSVAEAYNIKQSSMENTLLAGDVVIGNKFLYGIRIPFTGIRLPALREPRPGDIILLDSPIEKGVRLVKRVIAVGGQTVEIRNKRLYVDGTFQPLPAGARPVGEEVLPATISARDNLGPLEVPAGRLFVMGDNRDFSLDSRGWGFVDRDRVLARALFVLYSWNDDPTLPPWARPRWGRFGHTID